MFGQIKEFYKKDPLFFYLCAAAFAFFFLKLYHLAYQSLWMDEGFGILAAQKILKKGYPLYPSGHIYFKSIAYSYSLALFSLIFGKNVFAWRLFSLILHIITPLVIYQVGKKYLNRSVLAVAGTVLLLFTWETEFARSALYYSQVQLLLSLSVFLFIRNRLFAERKFFAVWWILACLSHQLAMGLAFVFPTLLLIDWRKFIKKKNLFSLLFWAPFFAFIMLQEVLLWKVGQVYSTQGVDSTGNIIQYFFKSFKLIYLKLLHQTHPISFKIFLLGMLALLIYYIHTKYIKKERPRAQETLLVFMGFWLLLTILGLGLMRTHPMPRYLFPYHFIFIILVVAFIHMFLQLLAQRIKWLQRSRLTLIILLLLSYLSFSQASLVKVVQVVCRDYTDPVKTDIIYTSGRPYPVDHQILGQFVKKEIKDTDVVIAIHMIFQYLEIGRVDYWLFSGGVGTWDAWEKVNDRWRDFYLGSSWINTLQKLKQVIKDSLAQHKRVWLITSNSEAKRSHIATKIQAFLKTNRPRVQWISRDGIGKVYLFSSEPQNQLPTYQAQWGIYTKAQLVTEAGKKWIKLEKGKAFKSALIFSGPAKKRLFFSFQQKSKQTVLAISTIRLGKIETTRLVGVKGTRIRYMADFRHKGRYALQIKHVKGPPVYLHDINAPAND